jgi:hypothetical protein
MAQGQASSHLVRILLPSPFALAQRRDRLQNSLDILTEEVVFAL